MVQHAGLGRGFSQPGRWLGSASASDAVIGAAAPLELLAADRAVLEDITQDARGALRTICTNAAVIEGVGKQVAANTMALYSRTGAAAPWISYFARERATRHIVGVCAFVAPPEDGEVEIAYFTFPLYEGSGFATAMAGLLIAVAATHSECRVLTANTLPLENPSTRILAKHGFARSGLGRDVDAGEVWHWRRQIA